MKKLIVFVIMLVVLTSAAFSAKWFSLNATDEWGDETNKKYLACLSDTAVYSNSVVSNDDMYYCSIIYDPDKALNSGFLSYILARAYRYNKGPGFSDFSNPVKPIDIDVSYQDTIITIKCFILVDVGVIYPADNNEELKLVNIAKATHTKGGRLRIKGALLDNGWSFRAQFNF